MLWVSIVLLCAAAVSAKDVCCMPKQWEGKVFEMGSVKLFRHPHGFMDFATISYDDTNQQVAVDTHYMTRFKKGEVKFILNFKEKNMYIIFGKKCMVHPIKFPYRPCCISDQAKKVGSTFFGAGSDKLDVTSYQFSKHNITMITTVTKECIPVGEMGWGRIKKAKFFISMGFTGITAGIKDPKVFVPPATCKKAEGMKSMLGLFTDFKDMHAHKGTFGDIVSKIRDVGAKVVPEMEHEGSLKWHKKNDKEVHEKLTNMAHYFMHRLSQ